MKTSKMADAIGEVNEKYITEAVSYKANKKTMYAAVATVAALAACILLVFGIGMFKSSDVDSIISIDVNPSIELTVSKHNKVLSANALNEDARIVLSDMDFKNVDLNTALNAIMGSLLKNGYLDEIYNAINVCVENNDTERAQQLGDVISGEIGSIFDENDLIGGINTQLCSSNDDSKRLADSYGVSVGKLGLAQTVSQNMGIPLDTTVKFSISELWDLLDAENSGIIMKEEALKIALEDAQLEEPDVVVESNRIRENNGLFTYAIKFTVGEYEVYEYVIDAINKTILDREYEYNSEVDNSEEDASDEVTTTEAETAVAETTIEEADVTDTTTADETTAAETTVAETTVETTEPKPVKHITKKEALAIVCADAGVTESEVALDELKHKPVEKEYHIEFSVGLCDYSYIISDIDGSIIHKETFEKTSADGTTDGTLSGTVISVDKALEIVLVKAGVELSDLTKCDIKYTNTKEGAEYKVHFQVDKEHYDYTVNALTGEIVEKVHPTPMEPLKSHENEEAGTPVNPLKPHEKEEAAKPAAPTPPAGPEDSKITITFEEQTS